MCVEGVCLAPEVVFADSWEITEIEVTVPRRVEPSICLDGEGLFFCPTGRPSADFWGCVCPPDPQVEVWVSSAPEPAMLAGRSDAVNKADQAHWTLQTPIALLLLPTSEILLKVVDQDGDTYEPIFECSIAADPDLLGQGVLTCSASFKTDQGATKTYEIQAHVSPVSM
jgi:hypothetical protein